MFVPKFPGVNCDPGLQLGYFSRHREEIDSLVELSSGGTVGMQAVVLEEVSTYLGRIWDQGTIMQ